MLRRQQCCEHPYLSRTNHYDIRISHRSSLRFSPIHSELKRGGNPVTTECSGHNKIIPINKLISTAAAGSTSERSRKSSEDAKCSMVKVYGMKRGWVCLKERNYFRGLDGKT